MEETKATAAEVSTALTPSIEATINRTLNLADFQNAVPLLRELSIFNQTLGELKEIELKVFSEPAFLKSKVWRVDVVGAQCRYPIPELDLQLEGSLLSRLTEAETATVIFVLQCRGVDREELARLQVTVQLLPRNQWGGLSHMPQMVAAFVQPNEPAVERLLKNAAEVLATNGRSAALDGYIGGPRRAWELSSAIWTAVAGMGLDYALPPTSFEQLGQKVRGPGQISESGLATCLDLSLFFCAALEQAGLNSLLVFTKDHAFPGVWLKQEEFSTSVVDDISALRKRVKLKELILFETTLITQRPVATFTRATELGALRISEANEDVFEMAVDVRRARLQRIKPLASAEARIVVAKVEQLHVQGSNFAQAPDDVPIENQGSPGASEIVQSMRGQDRLARWKRKLLDLSLRNNLLNFRDGKKTLKLEAPDPGELEDLLAGGHALKLLSRPDLMDGADPRSKAIYEGREHEDVMRGHALDALKRREVFVSVAPEELDSRLIELYRAARASLEEGGANILFLAVGFLTWTKDSKDNQRYRAPLILVPVALNRRSARSGFTLTLRDDEPRFNPTLIEMLHQDFKLDLGVADGELPKDAAGLDLSAIWGLVSRSVKVIKGWEVTEDVVLSTFSFAKYLMWKDLTERTDQLRESPVVRHLLDTPRDRYPSATAFPDPKRLDIEYTPEMTFCPLPVDSSQLSAVIAAAKGKDFVLIGPPGTGKSQTISNIIAQCIAEHKRVLFVSEKMAALDVVYRRLREAGLGEFCLELHSNKANKNKVLAQLRSSWEALGETDPELWKAEAERLKSLRTRLNSYVDKLHFRYLNGMTIYEAIGRVSIGADVPAVRLGWSSPDGHTPAFMAEMRDIADRLEENAQAVGVGGTSVNPLEVIQHDDWSSRWQGALIESAEGTLRVAEAVQEASDELARSMELPALPSNGGARAALAEIARSLPTAFGRDWRFALRPDTKAVCDQLLNALALLGKHRKFTEELSEGWPDASVGACRRGLDLLARHREVKAKLGGPWPDGLRDEFQRGLGLLNAMHQTGMQLSVQYDGSIEQQNVVHLQREWAKAEASIWPLSSLRKRKISAVLTPFITSEGERNFGPDLGLLVKLRTLRAEISAIDISSLTDGVWSGLKTRTELASCALGFQDALSAAWNQRIWNDSSFELIDSGLCGEKMSRQLGELRLLRRVEQELLGIEPVEAMASGLWTGCGTRISSLDAALSFQTELKSVRRFGLPAGEHEAIARGECGTVMAADLERLQGRAEVEQELSEFTYLRDVTAGLWDGLKTNANSVVEAIRFQASLTTAISALTATPDEMARLKAPLSTLLGDGNALLASSGLVAQSCGQYRDAWTPLQRALDELSAHAGLDSERNGAWADLPLSLVISQTRDLIQSESGLRAWCSWRKVCREAFAVGLKPLVLGIERGRVGPGTVRKTFETDYSRWWLKAVVDEDDVIRTFVSAEHEKRITDFRALDDRFTALTKAWIRAGLCAKMPTQERAMKDSEWGILRHEINKKKGHMPLRQLIGSVPSALTQLTPCLLMSPLSIAQYLAADSTKFDVVVFDEASQIPIWDALGAMARGKQVVMVGDPKQLPPSNFFDRSDSDSEDENDEGDLESILDECLGASLPVHKLAWHYRSRNESLIAFSNYRYYGGELVTFPSPVAEDRAVSFHHVAGTYEKGGARINKSEAKALVADVVGRLKSPGFQQSGLTIGVVTFNSQQQTLIEDLLDNERRKDPLIEPYFSETALEPVFVKNLESVQGDERDIMYFSITYGPDLSGTVSMNFGPMNRQGGERRLNVAITRARCELRVFSSLKPEQMDLGRTQAIGVRDLKTFLEFAERGIRALAERKFGGIDDFESPFEEAVAAALRGKGWELHTQIGTSVFRVDLGVIHPDAPRTYLTGVECDGATYHRTVTARDRDKLREQVLRGLGWEIVRIWSPDWWIDKAGTLEKVHAKLEALLAQSRFRRAESIAPSPPAMAVADSARRDQNAASLVASPRSAPMTAALILDFNPSPSFPLVTTIAASRVNPEPGVRSTRFVVSDPTTVVAGVDADAFFAASYDGVLRQMIDHIVTVEGPVLDAVLALRVARAHKWQRTGSRIRERISSLATSMFTKTEEEVGMFYWAEGQGPETPLVFRRSAGAVARTVQEICREELKALAEEIKDSGHQGETAVILMAREVGLLRLVGASRDRLEQALQAVGGFVRNE